MYQSRPRSLVWSCGNRGASPQNVFRQLRNKFGLPPGAPDFTWVELSTKRGRKTPHPVILPHRFFEQYYHHRRELFWERIACSSDACFNFWDSVKDSRCRASSTIPGIEWHDFSDHPGWEGTEWSHEDYCTYLRLAGYAIPVLFALCIGFRLECICIDHLHCVDLGVASIFFRQYFMVLFDP